MGDPLWTRVPIEPPAAPGEEALRQRLSELSKQAVGAVRLRQARTKRARARRRQQRHTGKLRAGVGMSSVLEELAGNQMAFGDFQRRLHFFLDFVNGQQLDVDRDKGLDEACTD